MKEHKEEVEKISKSRVCTRYSKKQLEGDRWKSSITDHASCPTKVEIPSRQLLLFLMMAEISEDETMQYSQTTS